MLIYEVELRHQDVHCGHSHEGREHAQYHGGFHDSLASLEIETGHGIGRQNRKERSQYATHTRNEKSIAKPPWVVVHRGIRKQLTEGVQTVGRREETLKRVDTSGL